MTMTDTLRHAFSPADPARRRRMIVFTAGAALALVYALAWPMIERELARSRVAVSAAQLQLEGARAASAEIAGLKRAVRDVREGDPVAALARRSAELGAAVTSADVAEGRLRVVIAGIPFDRLARLVEALGRDEGLFLVEALLVPRVEPGSVRAELTFSRIR